jgi:hypothetical protein
MVFRADDADSGRRGEPDQEPQRRRMLALLHWQRYDHWTEADASTGRPIGVREQIIAVVSSRFGGAGGKLVVVTLGESCRELQHPLVEGGICRRFRLEVCGA